MNGKSVVEKSREETKPGNLRHQVPLVWVWEEWIERSLEYLSEPELLLKVQKKYNFTSK